MKYLHPILPFLFGMLFFSACKKEDPPTPSTTQTLELDITGLQAIDATYYVWVVGLVNDGSNQWPFNVGSFEVNAAGELSQTTFLDIAVPYPRNVFITIQYSGTPDPQKSQILEGDIVASIVDGLVENKAELRTDHQYSVGDFSTASGGYFLATPSDGDLTNEKSGLWWFNPTTMAGLNLPELNPTKWMYNGWVDVDGTYLSTGPFFQLEERDLTAPYKDSLPDYAFPGEDFLQNPPANVTFPLDLSGRPVLVTVQPTYYSADTPFFLEVFRGTIPANADSNTFYDLTNTSATISGITGRAELITE